MTESIPLEAQALGLTAKDYYRELTTMVRVAPKMSEIEKTNIFDEANAKLSQETIKKAKALIKSVGYDKAFFHAAELDYSKGGNGCISVSLYDFLLHREERAKTE
tara:strand:+ start:24668 stop:24982 length:315 start_codon:yes stop_codon:yes gene_type:complete